MFLFSFLFVMGRKTVFFGHQCLLCSAKGPELFTCKSRQGVAKINQACMYFVSRLYKEQKHKCTISVPTSFKE